MLERAGEVEFIAAAAEEAFRGEGRVIAVTGDAGAGKSSLVRVACTSVEAVRTVHGSCDPLATPRPLGPIRDIFGDLDGSLLAGEASHLAAISDALFAALRAAPTIVVIEDAQWIDEASVDCLRFIVRRIGALPVLVLLTYLTKRSARDTRYACYSETWHGRIELRP